MWDWHRIGCGTRRRGGAWLLLLCLAGIALDVRGSTDDGCVLHYNFESSASTAVTDLSGAGHHGVLRNVELGAGVDGQGAVFDGEGALVSVPLTDKLRNFTALTLECWVSPRIIRNSGLFWAAGNSDENNQGQAPFRLEYMGSAWNFRLLITASDGEVRMLQPAKPVLPELTFPEPTWYHVAGTYDGQVLVLYVNGQEVARKACKDRKVLAEVKEPLRIGHGVAKVWNSFGGRLDEVRLYDRALSAAEVQSQFTRRAAFKPAPEPAKDVAGTLDGKPYLPITGKQRWLSVDFVPAARGRLVLSNTGEWEVTAGNSHALGVVSLWGQAGRNAGFYRDVTGRVCLRPAGSVLELTGVTFDGRRVRQAVTVGAANEINCRYEMQNPAERQTELTVAWPFAIFGAAYSFVGRENGQPVKGRLMDLDRTLRFADAAEVHLARSASRLLVRLGTDMVWEMPGTRDLERWAWGNVTYLSQIRKTGRVSGDTDVLEFSVQVTDDTGPPRLTDTGATEITPDQPLDFARAGSASETTQAVIRTPDREVPVYGIEESIRLEYSAKSQNLEALPTYELTVRDAYSKTAVFGEKGAVLNPWWTWFGQAQFTVPRPGVYNVEARFFDGNGTIIDSVAREIAVAGPIPQPGRNPDQPLPLKLVDAVDLTRPEPGHDFYSCSGDSPVIADGGSAYRQLLSRHEMTQRGTDRRDFIGARLKLADPTQDHVVEVVYADLDDSIIGMNVLEPLAQDGPNARVCITRVGSGVITGGVYPHDGTLKRVTMEYIPTGASPWCAVTCIAHGNSPAGVARINLYEVVGGLPQLPPLLNERLIGVHTESGEVGLGSFAYEDIAGEFRWYVPPERYYATMYRAVANLIRFMRFRGENVYNFGVYRYFRANFPSRYAGSTQGYASRSLDLPALMARMFDYNDLKIVLNVAPTAPLNIEQHYRNSMYDVIQGKPEPRPVSSAGRLDAAPWGVPIANAFDPVVQDEYLKYAVELGARYGKHQSLAGISWLYGAGGLGEPCLAQPFTAKVGRGDRSRLTDLFFKYSYDDTTMAQFAQFADVTLPGVMGDPKRFQQRYEWIMANALDKWIDFRCVAMGRLHQRYAAAFRAQVPTGKYFLFDYFGFALQNDVSDMSPLDLARRMGSDPRVFAAIPGLVYCPYVPTVDGSQLDDAAHGHSSREIALRMRQFPFQSDFYALADTGAESGRYLHRQFFETRTKADPKRSWLFDHGRHMAGNPGWLAHNNYPQPGGDNWFADFALMLAWGTPSYISWMWCDGLPPSGHFAEMQAFSRAYRQLPLDEYKTLNKQDGCFLRASEKAFYLVETQGKSAVCDLPEAVKTGSWRDAVNGERVGTSPTGAGQVTLRPYGFRVFLREQP